MTDYLTSHYDSRTTVQTEPITGREAEMVQNRAGGFVFKADDWERLDRFLVLGSEGGTYYATERELTLENARACQNCIKEDGIRVVNRVVEFSDKGRIPKNDTALFVLAMASAYGDKATRAYANKNLNKVARIGTHLFHWAKYRNMFGGWGTGARTAVQHWYLDKPLDKLAYQLIKYRQRDGWSHLDLLRLAHVKPTNKDYNSLFAYVKAKTKGTEVSLVNLPPQVIAAELLPNTLVDSGLDDVIKDIKQYNLPFEVLPTDILKFPEIWQALLEDMPMTAMIRNLARMTSIGLLKPMSKSVTRVVDELTNQDKILKARVHPVQILSALLTYKQGHGMRGKLSWKPVPDILDALDKAFYLSFGNVEPTGKRILIGVDVSGSMTCGEIAGVPGLTPNIGAAALSLITKATEKTCHIMGFAHTFRDLGITPNMRLDEAMRRTQDYSFGSTNCSLPMKWALQNNVDVDAFIVITDNETWSGSQHPTQALKEYRKKTGIQSKFIVIAMTATDCTITDPNDFGSLSVVGFDVAAPQLISDFIRK